MIYGGLHYDPDMAAVAAKYRVPVIIMHNSNDTNYDDIIEDMKAYFFSAVDKALKEGVQPQNIWLDPGIGFGKTEEQNMRYYNDFRRKLQLMNIRCYWHLVENAL